MISGVTLLQRKISLLISKRAIESFVYGWKNKSDIVTGRICGGWTSYFTPENHKSGDQEYYDRYYNKCYS